MRALRVADGWYDRESGGRRNALHHCNPMARGRIEAVCDTPSIDFPQIRADLRGIDVEQQHRKHGYDVDA